MLELAGLPFSVGRARFLDAPPTSNSSSARIYVKIGVAGMEEPLLALLDTGAEYSVIAREVAEEVGLTDADGQQIEMGSRFGTTPGRLVRTTLTVLADDGESLEVDATVFVPDGDWPVGLNFLGYQGFLMSLRLGLDPASNDIYFGGY